MQKTNNQKNNCFNKFLKWIRGLDFFVVWLENLLFPKFCLRCQKEGTYLCDDCLSLLDIAEFNYCLCNKKPILIPPQQKSGKCQKCQNQKLAGLYFALPFNLPAGRQEKTLTKKLIYQFKYQPYIKELAKTLASILIEHFIVSGKNTDEIWGNSVLVPVPLDKKKIKIRGYNQSEELAKELAKVLQIPVISDVLIKTKSTSPQMELSKEEREKNLLNAFAISYACHSRESGNPVVIASEAKQSFDLPFDLRGKKIFLVDDVYTTGSTMEECAKTLKKSGVKQVWGIAIAREG